MQTTRCDRCDKDTTKVVPLQIGQATGDLCPDCEAAVFGQFADWARPPMRAMGLFDRPPVHGRTREEIEAAQAPAPPETVQ